MKILKFLGTFILFLALYFLFKSSLDSSKPRYITHPQIVNFCYDYTSDFYKTLGDTLRKIDFDNDSILVAKFAKICINNCQPTCDTLVSQYKERYRLFLHMPLLFTNDEEKLYRMKKESRKGYIDSILAWKEWKGLGQLRYLSDDFLDQYFGTNFGKWRKTSRQIEDRKNHNIN